MKSKKLILGYSIYGYYLNGCGDAYEYGKIDDFSTKEYAKEALAKYKKNPRKYRIDEYRLDSLDIDPIICRK